jgi:hypothetical protein
VGSKNHTTTPVRALHLAHYITINSFQANVAAKKVCKRMHGNLREYIIAQQNVMHCWHKQCWASKSAAADLVRLELCDISPDYSLCWRQKISFCMTPELTALHYETHKTNLNAKNKQLF